MKGTNISDIEGHLFDVIERLKSGDDPDCDPKDGIKLETAKAIIDASAVLVDIQKVKVSIVRTVAKYDDPTHYMRQQGMLEEQLPDHQSINHEK